MRLQNEILTSLDVVTMIPDVLPVTPHEAEAIMIVLHLLSRMLPVPGAP